MSEREMLAAMEAWWGKPLDGTYLPPFEAGWNAALAASAPPGAEPSEAMRQSNLARARGLAEAIAKASPYPPNMDGVRDVAAEIVSLLTEGTDQ